MTTDHEARELYYSGRVQGVGFRYTVASIARQYRVAGYVENLPDGRVHLLVEGAARDLEQMLAEIARQMQGFIHEVKMSARSASGNFDRFTIRY